MNNKRLTINLISNIISFIVGVMISFFLSPYIVRTLGKEAYGFIPMMNNILSMSQVVTVAINSMGARFITIAYHKKDYVLANKYFSSLFYANLLLGIAIMVLSLVMILFVESFLDVPIALVSDVKISFFILALAFSLGLIFNVFSTATYVKNRIDMSAKREIIYQLIRGLVIFTLFAFFKPTMIYVAVATLIVTIYTIITNLRYTKLLMPNFHVKRKYLSFSALKELISSGIWNSFGRLSHTLMTGLDLVMSNIFISAAAMGSLSISKTIPTSIDSLVVTISVVFLPTITITYAKKTSEDVVQEIMRAIKIIGVVVSPVLAFLVGYGKDFYSLWQPTEDASLLQLLSVLAIAPLYFTLGMKSVGNVFTVTNKLKWHTISVFSCGLANIIIVLFLLKFTSLGIVAIAAVSSLCIIVNDLTFTPVYAAKCLGVKPGVFYGQIVKEFFLVMLSVGLSYGFNYLLPGKTWAELILYGGLSSIVILVMNAVIVLGIKNIRELTSIIFIRSR